MDIALVQRNAKVSVASPDTLPAGCVSFYRDECKRTWSVVPTVSELRDAFVKCCDGSGHVDD